MVIARKGYSGNSAPVVTRKRFKRYESPVTSRMNGMHRGNEMSNQATKKQPVRRYYLLAAILMLVGIAKFPFGQGASLDPNALSLSVALIAIAVACVLRARRNKRGE